MEAINSLAVEVIKSLISEDVKILDLKVKNKWLEATLSSSWRLKVLNG